MRTRRSKGENDVPPPKPGVCSTLHARMPMCFVIGFALCTGANAKEEDKYATRLAHVSKKDVQNGTDHCCYSKSRDEKLKTTGTGKSCTCLPSAVVINIGGRATSS